MHIRTSIINKIVSILSDSPTNWQAVFAQRAAMQRVLDTYLLVYFSGEEADKITVHPVSQYSCRVSLQIDAIVRVDSLGGLESKIDAITQEIQTKLTFSALRALTSEVLDLSYLGSSVDIDETDPRAAVVSQTWQFIFSMAEGSPSI